MQEREPRKENIGKGELFFLAHPGTKDTFSGYGLTMQPENKGFLVGLLMIDRPSPADPTWLQEIEEAFGEYQLVPMTASGERGIVCQMQIEPSSLPQLRKLPSGKAAAMQEALQPLLEKTPKPAFILHWDEEVRAWRSELAPIGTLPKEIREVFEEFGYGCLTAETNMGIVHVCHAADQDVEGFKNKPVWYQWQLIKMPSAPLIRMEIAVIDEPDNPFRFETFLNVADEGQAQVLSTLANQGKLYFAFYGDELTPKFTKTVPHDEQQWQQLDELIEEAISYWKSLPPEQRNFDVAKRAFMSQHP